MHKVPDFGSTVVANPQCYTNQTLYITFTDVCWWEFFKLFPSQGIARSYKMGNYTNVTTRYFGSIHLKSGWSGSVRKMT